MENCHTNEDCFGMYCGRINLSNQTNECFSSCQACPVGFRVSINDSSVCEPCDSPASVRDFLYFTFMCLVVLVMRCTVVTTTNWKKPTPWIIPVYVVPIIEVAVSMLLTLLSLPPQGSLNLYSCSVDSISDFYPIFFNPSLNYVNRLHCTYEVVYPLYSMVFIFFGFYFAVHLPLLITILVWPRGNSSCNGWGVVWRRNTEFLWLILYPVIVLVHSILAGIIYYSFEYITIVVSVSTYAILSTVLLFTKETPFKNPFKIYVSLIQWALLVGCISFLSCGILSLTEWGSVTQRARYLPLVLLLPLLHPLITLFTSPETQCQSWKIDYE